jgi:type I restriction enzyme S subunit
VNAPTPVGWPTVELNAVIIDLQPGFASGKHNTSGEGVPHFRPMNVSTGGRIDRSVVKYVDPSAGRPDLRLQRGDVLFNNTNSPELVGKTAIFEGDDAPAFSNHMTRLRVDAARVDPGFLALRLHQAWREGWFAAHCNNHVSQASIGRDVLRAFEIEVPPLEVQQAIYALNEVVGERQASSVRHLAAARRAIERFRAAVLVAACSGRLTADWREAQPQPGKGVDELLRKLRAPRGESIEHESSAETSVDLPETWRIATGAEAFVFVTSGSRGWARYYSDEGPAFLRVGNLDRHRLDLDLTAVQAVMPPPSAEAKRTRVQPGDLLISITAEVGMVGVVPSDLGEGYVNQHVAIARPHPQLDSRFLAVFVAAPLHGETQLDALQRGATKAGLGLDDIRALRIPLPPAVEQVEIARRVDQLLALADALEQRIEVASRRVDRSSQAVLAKAFRGDLTPSLDGAGEGVDA